jgi:adenine-specific DNA methylase
MSIIKPLKYWVKQVEILKNWTHYSEWSNAEFKVLSEEISEHSGTRITRNAIRKIVEKLSNEDHNYNPQAATKNALAQHIGCANWKELESKAYSESEKKELESNVYLKSKKKLSPQKWGIAAGLLVIIGVLGILLF